MGWREVAIFGDDLCSDIPIMKLSDGLPWWPRGLRHCQRLLDISQILAWACKKVVSDFGLDSGFL